GNAVLGLGAKRVQQLIQALGVGLAVEFDAQRFGTRLAGQLQIVKLLGDDAHAARVIVVADLALDDDQLVFAQAGTMFFVEFVEHRNLQLGGAVIENREDHFATPGHHGAHASQHAAHPLQIALWLDAGELRRHDAADLVAPVIKQMAAEVKAECGFFLSQLGVQIPRRDLAELAGDDFAAVIAKQRRLVGAAGGLLGGLHGGADRGQHGGAIGLDRVERAGAYERLDSAAIDRVFADTAAEVEQIRKRTVRLACTQDFLDRALPRAL